MQSALVAKAGVRCTTCIRACKRAVSDYSEKFPQTQHEVPTVKLQFASHRHLLQILASQGLTLLSPILTTGLQNFWYRTRRLCTTSLVLSQILSDGRPRWCWRLHRWQDGDWGDILSGPSDLLWWMDSTTNLSLAHLFSLNGALKSWNSSWKISSSHRSPALCTRMQIMACLFKGWWCHKMECMKVHVHQYLVNLVAQGALRSLVNIND